MGNRFSFFHSILYDFVDLCDCYKEFGVDSFNAVPKQRTFLREKVKVRLYKIEVVSPYFLFFFKLFYIFYFLKKFY